MSTSGTTIYQLGRDAIITAAIRKLGVIAEGQTPTAEAISDASMALNMLVASFRSMGMPLWARKTYTFNPIANQQNYEIGVSKQFDTPYPLHILQAYRTDSGSTTKINMDIIANYNLNMYPTSSGGTPIQVSYQPLNNYGIISLWPVPDTTATSSTVTLVYQAPFQYFNSSTDTMDFPEEWYLALVFNLAVLIAPEWTIPLADRDKLQRMADEYLKIAKENGPEDASLFIQPTRRQ